MLFAIHVLCPAFPTSAAALWAGTLFRTTKLSSNKLAYWMDFVGAIMAGALFIVGVYETIVDDDNGVGIFHLVNSTVLLILTLPRLSQGLQDNESQHILMGRPCYQEKQADTTAAMRVTEAIATNKEQELSKSKLQKDDITESTDQHSVV